MGPLAGHVIQEFLMTFNDFDIDPRCLRVLERDGIAIPTPVQEQAIPPALEGRDLIATAQTGTGKTLGFTLPSLTRLAQHAPRKFRMLVLTPTRELAQQVHAVADEMSRALHLKTALLHGGVAFGPQLDAIHAGPDIVVATPGRLLDHMRQGKVRFGELEILVLDEADRMLDMGFLPDIRRIISKLPRERQTLMFSATFADELERLVKEFMHEPVRIAVGSVNKPVDQVRQVVYPVRQEDKSSLLVKILEEAENLESAIIFLRTKDRTYRLDKTLRKHGIKAAAIHGDLSQKQRQIALDGFRSGKYRVLVATDVAARGLDIDTVSHVINYDIPPNADDYIHRIGRTARASREGDAVTFVTPQEHNELAAVERALGRNLPREMAENAPQVLSMYKSPGDVRADSMSRRGTVKRSRRRMLR
jgi:ATP-dependent RNA helicase RhlE